LQRFERTKLRTQWQPTWQRAAAKKLTSWF
jgi:hypothetical protein